MKISTKFFVALFITAFAYTAQAQDLFWPLPANTADVAIAQFDGSLDGWTVVGISNEDAVFVWEADGLADQGAYSTGTGDVAIASPSVANGAAVFDSDFLDNGGVAGEFGAGIAPSRQATELVSPVIDLSAASNGLALSFNQYLREFDTNYFVAYSLDGGTTWSDNIPFNVDYTGNTVSPTDEVVTVPLPGATPTSTFRFKFVLDADYYFIVLDDVSIISRLENDMQVNENFYAISPMYGVPESQVQEFSFLADISNRGSADQTNVVLNMSIDAPSGSQTYTADNDYGTVMADSTVENINFGAYTPSDGIGVYNALYTISADAEDQDMSNNSIPFSFAVTDSTYSKEPAPTRSVLINPSVWTGGENHQWAYGTHYHTVSSTNTEGNQLFIRTVTFSVDPDAEAAGEIVSIIVYKFASEAADDSSISSLERERVAIANYTLTGSETFDQLITLPVTDIFTSLSAPLEADADYIVMLEYTGQSEANCSFGAATIDYAASDFNAAEQGLISFDQIIAYSGNIADMDYDINGFASIVPVARLNIGTALFSSNDNILLPENTVAITPNPAQDVANVSLSFENTMEAVNLSILDVQGKVVRQASLENVTAQQVTIDINDLPSGTYMLNVTTEAGQLTKRLIKQ